MTSDVLTAAPAAPLAAPRASTTALAVAGAVGSPMMFFMGAGMQAPVGGGYNVRGVAIQLVYLAGWACTLVALRRRRATGDGAGARRFFRVQLALLAVAAAFTLLEPVYGSARPGWLGVLDAAWPVSHVLMLALGVAIVRAGRLGGWRRVPAFLVGLALPSVMAARAAGATGGPAMMSFPALTAAGLLLLAAAAYAPGAPPRAA